MSNIKAAKRLDSFGEYVFSRLNKEVAKVEAESGRKVLNFGLGSPDIAPSKIYLDKYAEFIYAKGSHIYPGYGAQAEFSDALINWYQKRFGVEISANELMPLLGGKDATGHLPLALADPGDEILTPDPGYAGYIAPILMAGAKPITYSLLEKNNFKPDLAEIESKITPRTRFIWVNFPANPTGQVASLEELGKLVNLALKHNIWLIYDNAYSEIAFNGFCAPSILEIPGAKEIAVELGSFSKAFSFAGFRMGWLVGNATVIQALSKLKSQLDSGLSTPLQKLGAFALNNPDKKWLTKTIKTYQDRRDILGDNLKKLGLSFSLPKGGLYIWAKIPTGYKSSEDFSLTLLREKQVLLAPGSAFGENGEGYIRASICVSTENIKEYFN